MTRNVLTLNAGSSSLKTALYGASDTPEMTGQVDGVGSSAPWLKAKWANGTVIERALPASENGHIGALGAVFDLVAEGAPEARIGAVSHRIVHGGADRSESVALTEPILRELEALSPYAPLHQPHNLAGVRAAIKAFPDAVQVACFDTAFHRGRPWVSDAFALPRSYYDEGVRRYGFHGLSYDYISRKLSALAPDLHKGRVIVAHLGNGASLCGLIGGRSIASTMGFSTLDGLPMGTRTGQIDPGVILYLLSEKKMDHGAITDLFYKKSGLLGLSGVSNDMRTLEASDRPEAKQAIAYFVFHIRREIGAMAAVLGGLDGLVFTGGIGENSALVRRQVCEGLGWMGVRINAEANERGEQDLSQPETAVQVLVLNTDEEAVLAREGRKSLGT